METDFITSRENDVSFMLAGDLKVGSFVLMKGNASRVVDLEISKTGKHGHTKVHYHGVDLFSGRRTEQVHPSDTRVEVPTVQRREYMVNYIDDEGFATLMDKEANTRCDLRLSDYDAGRQAEELFAAGKSAMITVMSAMGRDTIITVREDEFARA